MLNKETLEKAIAKGLNKAHGKTVTEQTAAVMNMIEVFEEVLGDSDTSSGTSIHHSERSFIPSSEALVAPGKQIISDPPTVFGGTPDLKWSKDYADFEEDDKQMPSRIGQSVKVESPIDGRNYRSSKEIQDALEALPKVITFPVGSKNLHAHRMISAGVAVYKAECVELQYAIEGLNHRADGNAAPRCKFWTTDAEFNPEKKLAELRVAMESYIKTLTRDKPIVAAQLAPQARPTDFSDAQETETFAPGSFNPKVFENWK